MSVYISFYLGNYTDKPEEEVSWGKVPSILSISGSQSLYHCINKFTYGKAQLVKEDVFDRIQSSIEELLSEKYDAVKEFEEIKDSILRGLPVKMDDYEEAVYRISQLNAEIKDIKDEIKFIIQKQGVIECIKDLVSDGFDITVLVG